MVRWGIAPSFERREWDQRPTVSLCQPIASRERARDIWPCHPEDCRWCISQLGSTLSSMKLWEWLKGEKTEREETREGTRSGAVEAAGSLSKAGLIFFFIVAFSSEATACSPESLRYFHSNVSFSARSRLTDQPPLNRHAKLHKKEKRPCGTACPPVKTNVWWFDSSTFIKSNIHSPTGRFDPFKIKPLKLRM